MGLMSLFGKGPLSEKRIGKAAQLACNAFAQPDVRMREMQRLLDDGSPAALRGVLKRFGANASGNIADEEEKKYLEDAMVDLGDAAIQPLESYIRSGTQLSYALRAYRRLRGGDAATAFFLDVLKAYGPDDHRSSEAKLQIIWQLADDLSVPAVLDVLTEFLQDHSDDVRWAIMDLLERGADEKLLSEQARVAACGYLAELVTTDDTGPRIIKRAAEILCAREWQLGGEADALAGQLDDAYFVDKKRFVRKRVQRP